VLTALALGLVIALMCVLVARRQFNAMATIEINKATNNSLGLPDLSGIAADIGDEEALNTDLLTEQAIIMNDNTALKVIEALKLEETPSYAFSPSKLGKDFGLASETGIPLESAPHRRERALRTFRSGLRVNVIKGTRLLNVIYTDADPNLAATIANTVVDVFADEYTQARYQASARVSSWLTRQLAGLKTKVEQSQAKVNAFEKDSGLTGMTSRLSGSEDRPGQIGIDRFSNNVPLQRLVELNRDLTNAEVARIGKEAIYAMAKAQDPDVVLGIGSSALAGSPGRESPIAPGSGDLVLLQQLRQQRAQLQVELAAAGTKYGAKNPMMTQLQSKAASLDMQISSELERIRKRAKNDLDLAVLAENGIRQRIATQEQLVNKVTGKADQLALLQEEALSDRAIYQDLYSKLEEASVAAGMKGSNITLVNSARVPAYPAYPRKMQILGVGALSGLLIGLFAVFWVDYCDDTITVPEQVEESISVPVIGAIPDFAQGRGLAVRYGRSSITRDAEQGRSNLWLVRAPRSHISEAYRSLRTALLMSRAETPPRVILMMSGLQGEGKSTTCLNIAAAFALQGDRVLYLDADLRRSQAHRFFDCANNVGLSNCLTGNLDFREAVKHHSEIETLFLLPAGTQPPNPAELLGSKRFAELLDELKTNFDYIFIDTPPILLVTDAQLISPLADGYVFVLRSRKTTKRALQKCQSSMQASKAPPLGIVLNALDIRNAMYSGYEYYGAGSGYYADATK